MGVPKSPKSKKAPTAPKQKPAPFWNKDRMLPPAPSELAFDQHVFEFQGERDNMGRVRKLGVLDE